MWRHHSRLHVPPVLPPHLEHRRSELPQATVLGRFHEDFEHILIPYGRLLQVLDRLRRFLAVRRAQVLHRSDLRFLLLLGGADHLLGQDGG